MQLETTRLILRDICEEDAPRIVELFAEPSAQTSILRNQRNSDKIALYANQAYLYSKLIAWASRPHFHLAITLRESSMVIGTCSISNAMPASTIARIGWHIGSSASGFGYATEAGRELIRFGFMERKAKRIFADCFASNDKNIRVFHKLGMQPVGPVNVVKWALALKYMEFRPIVRYATAHDHV